MKAIVVEKHGPEDELKLKEIVKPSVGKTQVLIEVKAVGVNPVDTYLRSGELTFMTPPFTPGFDGAGIVSEIGSEVTRYKIGDRVFTSLNHGGTYAEYVVADENDVFLLPISVDFKTGAALYIPYGTAYQALINVGNIQGNESVLIHGASGAVGLAAVQIAVDKGCTVIATAGSEKGRELVLENGATHALNHKDPVHYEKINEVTHGKGVDIILEMASKNIPDDFQVMSPFGKLIIIGGKDREEKINPFIFTNNGFSVTGVNIGHMNGEKRMEFYRYLYNGLENSKLKPVIHQIFSLEEANNAHSFLYNNSAYGKIVLNT